MHSTWQAPQMNRSPCLSRPTHTVWYGFVHTQQLVRRHLSFKWLPGIQGKQEMFRRGTIKTVFSLLFLHYGWPMPWKVSLTLRFPWFPWHHHSLQTRRCILHRMFPFSIAWKILSMEIIFIFHSKWRFRKISLVTWQAHAVAVDLVSFHARFCFKHPLRFFVPEKVRVNYRSWHCKEFTCPDWHYHRR